MVPYQPEAAPYFKRYVLGRAVNSKRGLNRRVSVGIVLVRHFVGLQQGL
jgi:hypothetical protein